MLDRSVVLTGVGALALLACGSAQAVDDLFSDATCAGCSTMQPVFDAPLQREVARQVFSALPAEQQAALLKQAMVIADRPVLVGPPASGAEYGKVSHLISDEGFERMRPLHRTMLTTLVERAEKGLVPAAACFAPGTDPELAMAFSEALFGQTLRFQQTNRWSSTATSGGGLGQGDPTTLTYSYPADGTFVQNIIGVTGNSQLTAWLNGIYGAPATWQALFDQVFDRWEEITGNTYVFEPNDDGVNVHSAAGVVGVRGDLRIAAIPIDGNSGILAYNNFPQDGDMVLDAFDSFYNITTQQSRRLRNIIAHEHGHGAGMLHVCPANATKLMEPFISTAYDGPQEDDILNGHRHYGDPLEHNDSIATASDFGTVTDSNPVNVGDVSIDDNSDVDYYEFTITEPRQLLATATPIGSSYQQGPQTQQCNSGAQTDYLVVHDLSLDVIDTDGVTTLASVDDNGVGQGESTLLILANPGTYYLRVDGDGTNSVQRYTLQFALFDLPFVPPTITLPNGVPTALDPGVAETFDVTIQANDDVIVGGSELLFYRYDGGAFQSAPLASLGGTAYQATLPAALCSDSPEFYVSVTGQTEGEVTNPSDGPSGPFSAVVGVAATPFDDNFEADMGWTVSGAVSGTAAGEWERGVPAGAGDRGDPNVDGDGSGACFLTGNAAGNTDVDGGTTILTSPTLDASGGGATVSYWRWYSNDFGNAPMADTFDVEISNDDGANWVTLETVGPTGSEVSGGWFFRSFDVASFVTPTNQVRVRFLASDLGDGSVVEAAVDGFTLTTFTCEDPGGCSPADLAEPFGALDFFDVLAYLDLFDQEDPAADLAAPFGAYDFFDVLAFLDLFDQGCP